MNRLVMLILLFVFWVFLTWPAELGLSYLHELCTGAVMALLVTWIMGSSEVESVARWLQPQRYFWALVYLFVLAAYVIKANLDVAYRALHPAMPIRPGIVKIKTHLQRPASRTALCNSITLTPGTLAVDARHDGSIMVHWINVGSVEPDAAAEQIVGRFEWFIQRIFE